MKLPKKTLKEQLPYIWNRLTIKTRWSVALAALCFFMPWDFIPDFIFGLGQMDDAGFILWALKNVYRDLKNTKEIGE